MPKRDGHGDCETCGGRCCRYVVVQIDKPTRKIDREEVRWFLAHENVLVYIDHDEKTWNVQFNTPCTHLTKSNRCRIYADRYKVCRDYDTETCEESDGEVDATIFHAPEEYDAWREKMKRKKRRKKGKKRRRGK